MYIITARRITSGELLKYRNGFCIRRRYRQPLLDSSELALTVPRRPMVRPSKDILDVLETVRDPDKGEDTRSRLRQEA
jgi:hypothetical protein